MADTVWSINALLRWTTDFLVKKRVESPRLDAEVLLASVLGCKRIDLYVRSEEVPSDSVRAQFRALIERRVQGCPVAYLVGRKEFFLLSFEVSPDVLIPRPSTESLVLAAIERLKSQPAKILDVGTGSGCIAVSLAVQMKAAKLIATDSSAPALAVALRNAKTHGVADRIEFRQGSFYEPVAGETFDAIVSNPPYIPSAVLAGLAADVRDHEPRAALDGGADGLDVIRPLIAGAAERLAPSGSLFLEFGAGQQVAVVELVQNTFGDVTVLWDADRIPRVLIARRT